MHEPRSFRIFRVVVVVVLGLFTLIPLYVMLTSSIKPLGDVQGDFTWWPAHPTLSPFVDMWSTVPLAKYFVNSLVVSVVATAFSVLSGSNPSAGNTIVAPLATQASTPSTMPKQWYSGTGMQSR